MPANTIVMVTGEASGDFIRVTTPGDIGWVFAAYVSAGTPSGDNPGGGGGGGGTVGTVTTGLNLRASPSTAAQILTVMPAGVAVTITGTASNGFLPFTCNGLIGWAASDDIQVGGGGPEPDNGSFRTTAALNLRQGPSVTTALLLVVPEDATVISGGVAASGYTAVSYNGTSGFVLSDFLVRV